MGSNIVYYYSKTGNNRYLAESIGKILKCDVEELKPRMGLFPLQFLSAITGVDTGIKKLKCDPKDYDNCIICGPLWFGGAVPAIRSFLRSYEKDAKNLHLITCCGSSDEKRNDRFGYEGSFNKLKKRFSMIKSFTPIPIILVLPKGKRGDGEAMMNARLNDKTFKGEIKSRIEKVAKGIR